MNIRMIQQKGKWKHTYVLDGDHINLVGIANRKIVFEKRKITINDDNNEIFVVKEASKFTPLLEKIPILNWFTTVSFSIEETGQQIGEIKVPPNFIQNKFYMRIKNVNYSCFYHRGGFKGDSYSIFKDEIQIGKIIRNKKVEWNAHSYYGEFDYDTNNMYICLFMVLIDVLWHTDDININEILYQNGYEVYWGLDMKYGKKPDLNWKPKIDR